MNTVSSASITGMVVSLILCVAAPVALCILLKRKTGAKLSDMLLGAVTFVIFAMFLEQMLHLAMSAVFGEKLTGNLWLSALYGGAAAAIFEEFGRLVAMKYFLGSQLEKENALMYGVGHGGVEALFVGGLTCVSNLATVSMGKRPRRAGRSRPGDLPGDNLSAVDASFLPILHGRRGAAHRVCSANLPVVSVLQKGISPCPRKHRFHTTLQSFCAITASSHNL